MAVVRTRSSPPYGLFAAVTVAVLALGGAVVCYLMWATATNDLHNAEARANAAITSAGSANKDKKTLTDDLAAAKRDLGNALADRNRFERTAKDLTDQLKTATDDRLRALREVETYRGNLDKQLADVKAELDQLSGSSGKTLESQNKAIADAQEALKKIVDDMEKLRRDRQVELDEYQTTIAKKDAEIRDLRLRILIASGNQGIKSDVGEADGQVIRVNGATGEVYINLTAKDHIVPGLTFTAYDPRTGVRYTTEESALGNGSLEVMEVGEKMSLCRITRNSKNRTIQANDLLANVVYHNDKARKYHFTVMGNFDLDGDGVSTSAERERIVLLIQRWGGQVDDNVTSQTDYLVVGERPAMPLESLDQPVAPAASTEPATEAASQPAPVKGSISDMAIKEQERYEDLIIQAKSLGIPVLNANRFLGMIGYYNTTVVRY